MESALPFPFGLLVSVFGVLAGVLWSGLTFMSCLDGFCRSFSVVLKRLGSVPQAPHRALHPLSDVSADLQAGGFVSESTSASSAGL